MRGPLEIVPSCTLDEDGLRSQRERQARLAPAITAVDRRTDALQVRFAPAFDRAALDELVAVERQCCPFFVFRFDPAERLLTVTVEDRSHEPALEAIAALLAGPPGSQ